MYAIRNKENYLQVFLGEWKKRSFHVRRSEQKG